MSLQYEVNPVVEIELIQDLVSRSNQNRSTDDIHRLIRIHPDANVVVVARDGKKLVGLARGLKEVSGCCYLSDLVVDPQYQSQGLGESLIRRVRDVVGPNALIVLTHAEDVAYA